MMCGGTGDVKPKDDKTQTIVDQVKLSFEEKNGAVSKFDLVSYKTQVVAGTNYFAKVDIGDGKFVHLRIFQALPHTGAGPELVKFLLDKSADDAVEYFD